MIEYIKGGLVILVILGVFIFILFLGYCSELKLPRPEDKIYCARSHNHCWCWYANSFELAPDDACEVEANMVEKRG